MSLPLLQAPPNIFTYYQKAQNSSLGNAQVSSAQTQILTDAKHSARI